ncbi:MAG TPA: hypothetical protein V6D47_07875 [Oscillatoriaceae cyanobacterium]
MEKKQVEKLPEFASRHEADALYGPAARDERHQLTFEREMAELGDKMIVEVMALFDDQGIDLDYSEESLVELEALIDELWHGEPIEEEALEAIVANWGAYLGLTIQQNIGGEWTFRKDLEHASIFFPRTGMEAFPMHKVRRRLVLGPQESLVNYYEGLIEELSRA